MEGKLPLQKQLYVGLCMYLCTYVLFRAFFFHCLVLSALRTILGLEGKCLSILPVIPLMDVWFCPQLKY